MEFDKPVVLLSDISEIMSPFESGRILEAKYLGGVPNVTYRVITERSRLAIRICNRGYTSAAHLDAEVAILRYLRAAGFREAPAPVIGKNGEYLQTWRGYPILATTLIDGRTGDQVRITPALCRDVGSKVASMQLQLSACTLALPDGETFRRRGERLLRSLPQTSTALGWTVDIHAIQDQWQRAVARMDSSHDKLRSGIVHTDVWPPNIICDHESVVGVIDFDDWAEGPVFIDIAACLVEFPMYKSLRFDAGLATELFAGYFCAGGILDAAERELLLDAMEATCVSWLACNAMHRIQFDESLIYLQKLDLFRDPSKRSIFEEQLNRCIDAASFIAAKAKS